MIGILTAKLQLLIRKPWAFIVLMVVCMLFAFLTGRGSVGTNTYPVYSSLPDDEVNALVDRLNQSEIFAFMVTTKEEAEEAVRSGTSSLAAELNGSNYTILTSAHMANLPLLQQHIGSVYAKKVQQDAVLASLTSENERQQAVDLFEQVETDPLLVYETLNFSNDQAKRYDNQIQGLFGFALFFVIYTIANGVAPILQEKEDRIWDRLIISSLHKWEMYAGNLLYSFLTGYLQVVIIFFTFRYAVGVDFYGGFGKTLVILIPYVLAIVAMSMLVAALSKSMRQFNALIPLLSVSFAMLGGAYWPLEIVSSELLLMLGKFTPIYYGMEALKGATLYGQTYAQLLQPISILLLIAVVLMGIGINAMEKRQQ